MMMEIVAVMAGAFVLAGFVPQIYKGYTTKSLVDLSYWLSILVFIGSFLWMWYSIHIDNIFILGVNIIAMFLTGTLILQKYLYER